MGQEKNFHVTTNTGTLHSQHDTMEQAETAATDATTKAAALGSKVTFVAVDGPRKEG